MCCLYMWCRRPFTVVMFHPPNKYAYLAYLSFAVVDGPEHMRYTSSFWISGGYFLIFVENMTIFRICPRGVMFLHTELYVKHLNIARLQSSVKHSHIFCGLACADVRANFFIIHISVNPSLISSFPCLCSTTQSRGVPNICVSHGGFGSN